MRKLDTRKFQVGWNRTMYDFYIMLRFISERITHLKQWCHEQIRSDQK